MAVEKQADVKHRQRTRGSKDENDSYIGLEGEITVDLTTPNLRLHDGKTLGGHAVEMKAESDLVRKRVAKTEAEIAKLPTDYVTVATNQAISGTKTFATISATTATCTTANVAALNLTSDARLKTNREEIKNALELISELTGYSYDLAVDGKRHSGLLAQDVEKVLPDAVSESENIKRLDYCAVVAILVNAVKELNRKVEALRLKE